MVLLFHNRLSLSLIFVLSFYLLVVILATAAISAPGIISSTPITAVLVDGNVIVVPVGSGLLYPLLCQPVHQAAKQPLNGKDIICLV